MINPNLFDHYSFRARLQPALVALLPAAFGIFAWTGPGVKWQSAMWTLFGTAGGTYFLAIVARNLGKQLEPNLWKSWGGAPTTQLLRHSGPANSTLRERWHKSLAKLIGKTFPTVEDEMSDSTGADEIYIAAVKLQIGKTRDTKKYHLLYKENVHYGFCRNLFALRPIGIAVSSLGFLSSCAAGIWFSHANDPKIAPWVCTIICATFLLVWIAVIKSSWVKIPAFAYAERLFESTEKTARNKKQESIEV